MTTLRTTPPQQCYAGDTIEYLEGIPSDYAGWTGAARLVGPTSQAGTVTTEGSDFRVKFSGQATGGTKELEPGQYTLVVYATQGTDRKVIAQHALTIQADPATTADPVESHAVKMLRIVTAAIEARLSGNDDGGIEAYSIDGTAITKVPLERLEQLRAKYRAEVSQEQNGGAFGSVKFAFTPAGAPVDMRSRFQQ